MNPLQYACFGTVSDNVDGDEIDLGTGTHWLQFGSAADCKKLRTSV